MAPHDLQTMASTHTTARPMRRPVPVIVRRQLTTPWPTTLWVTTACRTGLTAIEPTDTSAARSWPRQRANGCNRQHPHDPPMSLPMTSLEPHRSRSGHGRRKWWITTSEWHVQMHKAIRWS